MRNLLATLLTSRGTPMLAMGDELGRTQRGNNNAYAQDNALTWIDWPRADDALIAFTAALVALRKRHPALRQDRWLTGEPVDASGVPDVEWRHPDGRAMNGGDWSDADRRTLVAILYAGASDTDAGGSRRHRAQRERASGHRALAGRARRLGLARARRHDARRRAGRDDAPFAPTNPSSWLRARRSSSSRKRSPRTRSRRRRGAPADAELLERLANAAGIEPAWWDLAGGRHVVGADTQARAARRDGACRRRRPATRATAWPRSRTHASAARCRRWSSRARTSAGAGGAGDADAGAAPAP